MLERDNTPLTSKLIPSNKTQNINAIQDLILSISHRLSNVQNSLNSKIDRNQCMLILQSKANYSQIKKISDQLNTKYEKDKKLGEEKILEHRLESKKQIEKLKQKLKCKKKQVKKNVSQKNIFHVKPQELYLQSNETMFSIIVDQIAAIKQTQQIFQKNLQQRNKVTLSLNNQVCSKIQNLQRQIQSSLKQIKDNPKITQYHQSKQSWSNSEQFEQKNKDTYKSTLNKTQGNRINPQSHQISHIMRTIQALQKDISVKINIKDVLPLVKKNLHPITDAIDEVRRYAEQAIESTKKILMNQSQINQELCLVSKIAWWQSFEQKDGFALWNKQIANLVPQNFICGKDSNQLMIAQQGNYVVKLLGSNENIPQYIIVGGNQVQIIGESLIKLQKNSIIQVPSIGNQILFTIQKI